MRASPALRRRRRLVGLRTIAETVRPLGAWALELIAAELRRLNLESDEPGYE